MGSCHFLCLCCCLFGCKYQLCLCLTGNGIILQSACQCYQMIRNLLCQCCEHLTKQLIGIGTAFIDLGAGMSTLQTIYFQCCKDAGYSFSFKWHLCLHMASTCTACQQHTLTLRIQIYHGMSFEHGRIQCRCTFHSHFLAGGKDHLQAGMGNTFIIKKCQRISNGNSVISAKSRSLCIDVVTINGQFQTVLPKINGAAWFLLAYHIQMSL